MLLLGFSAGLPLLLVLGTLSFWLREAGVDRTTIGYLSWVGLAYAFKWVWAPLVDRLPIPLVTGWLGRRRSWLLLAQAMVVAGLVGMAFNDPRQDLMPLVWCALLVAFGSATQDIALDACRLEMPTLAKLAAAYQTQPVQVVAISVDGWDTHANQGAAEGQLATRLLYLDALISGLNDGLGDSWEDTVLLSPEPVRLPLAKNRNAAEWLKSVLVEPFADFLRRYRWQAALMLALIATYRISDVVMGIMANPFYVDMGYTKDEVATVTKIYGVVMTLAGAFIGGVLAMRLGVFKVLTLGAVLSAASNLLFAWLGSQGHDVTALVFVISADNLSSGIASAAFIAYLSSLTNLQYSATQYALFTSMMLLLPKFLAGYSGRYVDAFGYSHFFVATALLGVPVLLLLWLVARHRAH